MPVQVKQFNLVQETFGTATPFIIRELTGEKRTLSLAGRALPYRPITFSGTQRAEFTWYPGNPEATVQLFGAAEDNTTIKGQWKDKYVREFNDVGGQQIYTAVAEVSQEGLGPGQQVQDVASLIRLVDSFRRQGQLLEVRWDDVLRVGILVKFSQQWDRHQDVEWEMDFGWISQGDIPSAEILSGQIDLASIKSRWDALASKLRAAISALLGTLAMTKKIFDAVAKLGRALDDAISAITDAIAAVVQFVKSPLTLAKQLTGIYKNIKDSCGALADQLTSVPPPEQFLLSSVPVFQEQLRSNAYVQNVLKQARDMRRYAVEQLATTFNDVVPVLLGTYIAKEGDNLRDVSRAYYVDPGHWRDLMVFNNLTSSSLDAGQVVLVPRLDAST